MAPLFHFSMSHISHKRLHLRYVSITFSCTKGKLMIICVGNEKMVRIAYWFHSFPLFFRSFILILLVRRNCSSIITHEDSWSLYSSSIHFRWSDKQAPMRDQWLMYFFSLLSGLLSLLTSWAILLFSFCSFLFFYPTQSWSQWWLKKLLSKKSRTYQEENCNVTNK